MKKLILLSLALVIGLTTFAQEKFTEGKITLKQSMTSDVPEMKKVLESMAGEDGLRTISYVKGNLSRSEINNPMTGDITTISNADKKQVLMLMDTPTMEKKYTLTTVTKEQEEEIKKNVSIVEGTKTKTILGYDCKEHTVSLKQDGVTMEIVMYITDQIVPAVSQQTAMLGNELKGFPMYMEMRLDQGGMAMTIVTEVTELKSESLSDDLFSLTPPEGYSKM